MNGNEKEIIQETVRETLCALGVDMSEPIEVQKDFAYLRKNRKIAERLGIGTRLALIGAVFTGIAGLVIMVVQFAISGSK